MAKQAWAQNAVILSDDGSNQVRYKPRCPKCGYVPPSFETTGTALEGIYANYHYICDKCREKIDIVISRG